MTQVTINGNVYTTQTITAKVGSKDKSVYKLVSETTDRAWTFESEAKRQAFMDPWNRIHVALTALDSVFTAGMVCREGK